MKKFLKMLNLLKPKITLELDEDGFYVVKAYGVYLRDTVTRSKEEAEKFYQTVVEASKKRKSYTTVKEYNVA